MAGRVDVTLYNKTTIVKASYTATFLAQASTAMKVIDTDVVAAHLPLVTVFLNCDADGAGSLFVDVQITPDDSSQVWYKVGDFGEVLNDTVQKYFNPPALGKHLRCLPTLSGVHNFGSQILIPSGGYLGS